MPPKAVLGAPAVLPPAHQGGSSVACAPLGPRVPRGCTPKPKDRQQRGDLPKRPQETWGEPGRLQGGGRHLSAPGCCGAR